MDFVSRLIVAFAALFLSLSVTAAPLFYADTVVASRFATSQSACRAWAQATGRTYTSNTDTACVTNNGGAAVALYSLACNQSLVAAGVVYGQQSYTCGACPAGQTAVNGVCQTPVECPPGQTRDPDTNTCGCDSGYQVGGQMISGDGIKGCMGGCSILLQSGWYDKTANVTWGRDWKQTGSSCSVGEPPVLASADPKVTEAKKCGAGLCPGVANGQSVCVACSAPRETTSTKDTSTEVKTPASGASSASTSTSSGSSSTKCDGDKCTTTTTTTTTSPDGTKTDKATTKEQPKADFCTDNPKSTVCKEGGTWGGSCGSFSCDGDAVTCAIAQASWKSACALDLDSSDSKVQTGNSALSAGVRSAEHPGNNPDSKAFSAGINTTNPYGSSCPTDFVLNAYNHLVTVPLSSACDVFTWMGRLAVALALVAAGRIVFA